MTEARPVDEGVPLPPDTDNLASEAKWIDFHECVPRTKDAKTKTWAVVAREGGACLGAVKWFGRWRQYAFFPGPVTVYEPTCLRDIATFCEAMTTKHKKLALAAKETA